MGSRDLLMIPGPVEFEPEVLAALGARTPSHVDPEFIRIFGRALTRLRAVSLGSSCQPFVVAGSGTLAMELAVANLIEEGERALVVNTGYFSDRMATLLERHGAQVTQLRAEPGQAPDPAEVDQALRRASYKVLAITHVDTSTGVRVPLEAMLRVARDQEVLSIVDGVCATAAEPLRQDAWGAHVCLSASQKALGVPPGLALLTVSPKALSAFRARKTKVRSLYADFGEWLPIMEAYEAGRPSYFATPPVNLIRALEVSLSRILEEGMEERWARHARLASAMRSGLSALGLELLTKPGFEANTLSAVYYPPAVDASLLGRVAQEGVVLAGGLHPDLKARYFRVGHMGAVNASDVLATLGALGRALGSLGYRTDPGDGVAAAQRALG